MSLLNYWPNADEINDCIKHEAEGAHDAVLLAVHQPAPISYTQISSGEKFDSNENNLFKYLITKDVPSGSHIVPITGASGVGKSHMVRILTARLDSINKDGRYVIIRIPKSASLRRVVELILEKLPGDEYAQVKEDFSKALTEDLNIETAVVRFHGELNIALNNLTQKIEARAKANPQDAALREQWGHARSLSKFMGDPVLVDYFRETVFSRFVRRAVAGKHDDLLDTYVKDFDASDFQLPDDIDITKAAKSTQTYYIGTLSVREGEGMRSATRLLNEHNVVDQAVRQLFNLHEAVSGMTLQDVILEIRRILLTQERELVIFVEDFKALTGIQDILLKVLIQEGVRDGTRELATMRSVIAVTDGYLDSEDTITTRAKREWKVESEFSEDEVLRLTKALVASYLNAARWGHRELIRHYERNQGELNHQSAWIEPYSSDCDDNETVILEAFGRESGIPLFPYTEQAIEQLACSSLTKNNALVFTPRFIIDNILRAILLPGRPAFEQGLFPPTDIKVPGVSAEVTQWLAQLKVSDDVRERYRRVVVIWGNAPSSPDEIGYIPGEVFDAFKLERPNIELRTTHLTVRDEPTPPTLTTRPKSDDDYLIEALEKWSQKDERLPQQLANQIRKSLASAINDHIDWSYERCPKSTITASRISLPHAGGELGIATDAIVVANDHKDDTGQLRIELAAVTRYYHLNAGRINYEGADDDLVLIGNLVERLMPQAITLIHTARDLQLSMALRLLGTNSRILGLLENGNTPVSLASFLFGTPNVPLRPSQDSPNEFIEWTNLQEQAFQLRPELIELVAAYSGSYQGTTGRTLFAIDMVRIADCWHSISEVTTDLTKLDQISTDLKHKLSIMSEIRVTVLTRKILKTANSLHSKLVAEIGDNFDKQKLTETLRTLANQLKDFGAWSVVDIGMSHTEFQNSCDEFRNSALRESLTILSQLQEESSKPDHTKLITYMGRFKIQPLIAARNFVEAGRKVVSAAEKRAKSLEVQYQGVDPEAQAKQIQYLFELLLKKLDVLGRAGENTCS